MEPCEFQALVVDEINEKDLWRGVGMGDGPLPVRLVRLPVENISDVAVLSWRWDGDLRTRGSKNIASAVHQAKKMGVRYLFVDLVSVDQSLSGEALIQQVVLFSSLYRTIPVIAAYDYTDTGRGEEYVDFEETMRRPWIFYEARLYRYNTTKIVYVGHSNQGARHHPGNSFLGAEPILGLELWRFKFGETLGHVWTGSFFETITGLLCGKIGMADVSDLRFIIPPYAQVFTTAYKRMSRNDYLLTAAILCRTHAPVRDEPELGVSAAEYDRYSFWEVDREGAGSSWTSYYGIFPDGTQVGLWMHKHNERLDYNYFAVFPDAERVIFDALGLSEAEWEEFEGQVEARRRCLVMEGKDELPVPKVDIVSVEMELLEGNT
ncbi:hypothetical protein QBC40DRAFT_338213 [Triangularia verruculosa]|uniref:Uncharacterized protein n=1 Tax=Triangularia verruculosa TaxID=2587418 RepID=A0AAN6XKU9_9PEZI|nr:hypothetical protein QBC40DRAFT_338213 [Triangularia verruculosa]